MVWLLVTAGGCVVLLFTVHHVFVATPRGQLVDSAALQGAQIGRRWIIDPVLQVLDVVSAGALAAAGLAAAAVAVLRRRVVLAGVALTMVVGSNVTTQLLKYHLFTRPALGLPLEGLTTNTLPSGHTTVAMSVAAAAVLVAPSRLRGAVSLVAAAYGAATGVATLSAGYHRPSDAIAACLVVGAWAAGLGALVVLVAPQVGGAEHAGGHPFAATWLASAAATLLAAGAVATYVTARVLPASLDSAHLLVAYGGGAALIAGTAFAVVASLAVVVHRVVPPLPQPVPVGSAAV